MENHFSFKQSAEKLGSFTVEDEGNIIVEE